MIAFWLGLLTAKFIAVAAADSGDIWDRQAAVAKCEQELMDAKSWPDFEKSSVVDRQKLGTALGMTAGIEFPSDAALVSLESGLKSDFDKNYDKYRQVIKSDCPQLRTAMGMALLNTASREKEKTIEIIDNVRDGLRATKYHSFEEVETDLNLMDYGLRLKLWKLDPAVKKQITPIHQTLEANRADWRKRFEKPLATLNGNPTPKDLLALKDAFNQEQDQSAKLLNSIRDVAAKLYADPALRAGTKK